MHAIERECAAICDIKMAREAFGIDNCTRADAVEGHTFAIHTEVLSVQPVGRAFGKVQLY